MFIPFLIYFSYYQIVCNYTLFHVILRRAYAEIDRLSLLLLILLCDRFKTFWYFHALPFLYKITQFGLKLNVKNWQIKLKKLLFAVFDNNVTISWFINIVWGNKVILFNYLSCSVCQRFHLCLLKRKGLKSWNTKMYLEKP